MLNNRRPYTNENGWEDMELITDADKQTQEAVAEWIAVNISPRKTENKRYTSYRLKHLFEDASGIYLTNNAFKDAMLLAGYDPVNPNVLNRTYKINVRKAR